MAKLTAAQKKRARANAAKRGKKPGAYDWLRAAGKPMKPATGAKKKKKSAPTRKRKR